MSTVKRLNVQMNKIFSEVKLFRLLERRLNAQKRKIDKSAFQWTELFIQLRGKSLKGSAQARKIKKSQSTRRLFKVVRPIVKGQKFAG